MEQSTVPLSFALQLWAAELLIIIVWTKLCFGFSSLKPRRLPENFGKPKHKELYKEGSYPFDEGEPKDWFGLER